MTSFSFLPIMPGVYRDVKGHKWMLDVDGVWGRETSTDYVFLQPAHPTHDLLPFTHIEDQPTKENTMRQYKELNGTGRVTNGMYASFGNDPRKYRIASITTDPGHCDGRHSMPLIVDVTPHLPDTLIECSTQKPVFVPVDWSKITHLYERLCLPTPEGLDARMYLGSDGARYIYAPDCLEDDAPWRTADHTDEYEWVSGEELLDTHPDCLPMREFTTTGLEES